MLYYFAVLFFGIIIGIALFYLLGRRFSKTLTDVKLNPSSYSEAEAEKIIKNNGYKILEKHKKFPVITYVDGKSHLGFIVVDFIAEKDKLTYVVEVKTGEEIDTTEPLVRRKFLEYTYACRPNGILLLDMNSKNIQKISFKLPTAEREYFFRIFIVIFILFVITGIIGLLILLKLF
jgi:hypothetical protein